MAYRHVRLEVTVKIILVSIEHAQRQNLGEGKRLYMQIFRIVDLEPEAKTIKGLFYQNNFDISRKNVIKSLFLCKLSIFQLFLHKSSIFNS